MIPRVVRKLAIAIAFALCAAVLIGTVREVSTVAKILEEHWQTRSTAQPRKTQANAPKKYGVPRYGATQPKPSARLKDKNASSMKHCLRTRGS
jgi:hypothetical protein